MFYIDNTEDLINICNEIKNNTNIIALDTEFTKQKEYFPTLSIIQLSFFNGQIMKNCIVDVMSDDLKLDAFAEILQDDKIKKVFHSCSQDLEALYHIFGKVPVAVEDTQIMAEFCGMKSNLSYIDLIKDTLGIIVKKDKSIQSGNWKNRPLTDKQLEYASADVDYLLEIYIVLAQKLDKNKNFKYYRSHIEERYGSDMIENQIENSWRKMRFKIGNKTNIYMDALKEMCKLRENIAMEKNTIKNLIVPDSFIKSLLAEKPKTIDEINKIFEDDKEILNKSKLLKRRFIKAYSKVINRAETKKIEEKPYITELKDKAMIQKLEEINDYIISECKKMDINPELVQNKIDLSSYVSDSESLENLFEKWKIEVFGKRIKEIKER